jgi:OPA family glycerol-3-phosphate transporter-like MFS transporter
MGVKTIRPYVIISILSWLIYVMAYFGRVNLSIAIPWIEAEYGYSKAVLGLLASGFFAAYAGGQFINGVLGDRFNPRYFISIGLLTAGLSNLCFGLFPFLPVMFISWVINGYFQSMLWGPLFRTISEYVPAEKQHGAVFMMSTTASAGYFLSYTVVGKTALLTGWKTAFIMPGLLLMVMAAVWFRLLGHRNDVTAGRTTVSDGSPSDTGKPQKTGGLVYFFFSRKLYYIIILGIMIGAIKEGLTLWGPSLLADRGETGMEKALYFMSLIPLINISFIILNGLISKKRRNPRWPITIFVLLSLVSATLLQITGNYSFRALLFMFYLLMALVYSVNILMTSYLPLEYRNDGHISSAAGIIDSSFYLGAAIAGPAAGAAADRFGWPGIFIGLVVVCLAASLASIFVLQTKAPHSIFPAR